MKVCIASGKGGTGKTLISTSLALALEKTEPVQLLDCDVEAPNAHLFLNPSIRQRVPVVVPMPHVDDGVCAHCGECAQACRFNAIASLPNGTVVYEDLCHSCGVCADACPTGAITEVSREIGHVDIGQAGDIAFARGTLNVGEVRSSPVIAALKTYADRSRTVLLDAPPGTSCPVVETLRGCGLAIFVGEPTPFGLSDLRLAVETARALDLPFAVVVNRDGLGDDRLDRYCRDEAIPIWGRVPHDRGIAEACARGERAIETSEALRSAVEEVAERIRRFEMEGVL